MKHTGQILRDCREKKGITPSEVSMATKIGVKIIEAIERGDTRSLPSKAFLRGFIQTYATFLKLDTHEVMNSFLEETGGKDRRHASNNPSNTVDTPKAPSPLPLENKSQKIVIQAAIVLAVLIVILLVKFLINTIEKYEHDAKPPTPAEIATTLKNDTLAPEIKPESNVTPESAPAPIAVPPPAAVVPIAPTAPKVLAPTPAIPPPVETAKPTPAPVEKPSEPKKALSSETGATIQSKELIIEALDAVDIFYWVDGGPTKKVRLEPDQIQIIKAAKTIKVEVSDGGAIDVIFNGEDQGVPGKLGKSMQLSYP